MWTSHWKVEVKFTENPTFIHTGGRWRQQMSMALAFPACEPLARAMRAHVRCERTCSMRVSESSNAHRWLKTSIDCGKLNTLIKMASWPSKQSCGVCVSAHNTFKWSCCMTQWITRWGGLSIYSIAVWMQSSDISHFTPTLSWKILL